MPVSLVMPQKDNHVYQAVHNLEVLCHLSVNPNFADWMVTVACYSCIHLIEALLAIEDASKARTIHSTGHSERNLVLQTAYPTVWKKFRPIYDASLVARYLTKNANTGESFSYHYPYDTVVQKLFKKYFSGVIRNIETILGDKLDMQPVHQHLTRCLTILDKQKNA
jgi:hypothetical protein